MISKNIQSNFTQIAFGCDNVCDVSSISVSDIPDYLSNDGETTTGIFNCSFCDANYTKFSILMCSNVVKELLSEAQRRNAQIQIMSEGDVDKYFAFKKEYQLTIQPIQCDEFVNILSYSVYQSLIKPGDYNLTGIMNNKGRLNPNSVYFNIDLTRSRIIQKYDELFNGKKASSLIEASLLTAQSVNGFVIKICFNSFSHYQPKIMAISNVINVCFIHLHLFPHIINTNDHT